MINPWSILAAEGLLAGCAIRGAAGGGSGGFVTAKSVVIDATDNWGGANIGVRSIEFKKDGQLIVLDNTLSVAYGTSSISNRLPEHAFDTSLPKDGTSSYMEWVTSGGVNSMQRLIIVFNGPQSFDEIVINNSHHSGSYTDRGVKNIKVHTSTNEITSTVYDEAIANSTLIFDAQIAEHVPSNIEDEQTLTLINI